MIVAAINFMNFAFEVDGWTGIELEMPHFTWEGAISEADRRP